MVIRVDRKTWTRLVAASRRLGRTPSELARAALDAWLDAEKERARQAPHEGIADLIGCVRGGDAKRSTRGGRWIAEALRARSTRPAPPSDTRKVGEVWPRRT